MVALHPEHARGVLESLALGVLLMDTDDRVTWMNAYAARLLGCEPAELCGRTAAELDLPWAPPGDDDDPVTVQAAGNLLGLSQPYVHAGSRGSVLVLVERGHALAWYLGALAGSLPGASGGTGALSRAHIVSRLDAEISRSRRYANQLSCVSVRVRADADSSHRLAELARALKEQLRWVDVLGQWQDDALVLVLPETDLSSARALAEKLAAGLRLPAPEVMAELGVATWHRGETAEQLITRALASGRESVVAFSRSGRA